MGDRPPAIAIIGSACRLPGNASSPSKLWQLLREPRDLLKEIPPDRFNWEGYYRPDGKYTSTRSKDGYWLEENIRQFDAQFFSISPVEAESLDPQHRLLLENVYEAIESAGLTFEGLQGSDTGVFDTHGCGGPILSTGTARSMAANRISYTFDFRGPSMTLDTACSSSMMAVHLAVSSLRAGESTVAFACGSQLNLSPTDLLTLTKMTMVSPDGQSKMWDQSANGYGKGEGVAVVCLKRLDLAIQDGDHIECIIRETGTNQDGRTKGITMPSSEAQAELIRKTYLRAGLDPTTADGRPHFFEAHGTGTAVGDPLEAEAINAAFFPPETEYSDDEVLYLGSIKTIIGHTEGTAGVAGLLRAALAVRHGIIPPNRLFHRMNPAVVPHTKHLRLVTAANTWPKQLADGPRRASINSFGFGGSNVHIILESHDTGHAGLLPLGAAAQTLFTPLMFSAASERALRATLESYLEYLNDLTCPLSLRDLAWTLQCRRSQMAFRYAFSVASIEDLKRQLGAALQRASSETYSIIGTRASQSAQPTVVGVFTGQSSQWATMGKELIDHSAYARKIIDDLDMSLATLPESDRPRWRIAEELAAVGESSRINEALLSQPLTTAIQILLVSLLRIAGIKLAAVVGHSSGEITAAYAAGFITASDAVRIAFYRGLGSAHTAGKNGERGAMMVTAMAHEDAENLCNLPEFEGRVRVACYNSPTSVTISGDEEVIDLLTAKLSKENRFARKLQVNKAYHSHHMEGRADLHYRLLEKCSISLREPPANAPVWFSSALPGERMDSSESLRAKYWVDNAVSPVRFSQAITTVVSELGIPDMFIEIGPTSSLERPVIETIGVAADEPKIYTSFLKRGRNSIVSSSEALGVLWTRFGREAVDLVNYDQHLSNGPTPVLVKDLPTYPWQHDKEYWWESRFLRNKFQAKMPPTELLGEKLSFSGENVSKWRQFLKPKDVPWLLDHKLNGDAVLPGAAYVAMVTAAAERLFREKLIESIEIQDIEWLLPIVFFDEHTAVEIIVTVATIVSGAQQATADFSIEFCGQQRNDELNKAAGGKLNVRFGPDPDWSYPTAFSKPSHLVDVPIDHLYRSFADRGYGYTGPFRAITSLMRRMNFATGKIRWAPNEMMFHPALLDALLQASMVALAFPSDSAMPGFRVPFSARSIKIFPGRWKNFALSGNSLNFDVEQTGHHYFDGVLYGTNEEGTVLQMEGFHTQPFRMSTAEDDLTMYSEMEWRPFVPDLSLMESAFVPNANMRSHALDLERASIYYLRKLADEVSFREEQRVNGALRHLLQITRLTLAEVLLGLHPSLHKAWLEDTEEDLMGIVRRNPDSIDLKAIEALGKAYADIVRGKATVPTTLLANNMLEQLYTEGIYRREANGWLSHFVQILTNRSPNMRILEIGAGTGSTTERILDSLSFASYTFTDVSSHSLKSAQDRLRHLADRMAFKTLDMDTDFAQQGFQDASYEMVIACNVLHASSDVTSVLKRIRQVLRPGGYLLCLELSEQQPLNMTLLFGGFESWWAGHRKDRIWTPGLSEKQWKAYLKDSGFAGIDHITPMNDQLICPHRVFCAQAVDDMVMALRKPLAKYPTRSSESLLIICPDTSRYSTLHAGLKEELSPFYQAVLSIGSLEALGNLSSVPHSIVCLLELDSPIFRDMDSTKWAALQKLLGQSINVLWVMSGYKAANTEDAAYLGMTIGLIRSVQNELRDLRLAILDVDKPESLRARFLGAAMLRWQLLGQWAAEGWTDEVLFPHHHLTALVDGVLLTPFVVNSKRLNERYNAQHRKVTKKTFLRNVPIGIHYNPYKGPIGEYRLLEAPQASTHNSLRGCIRVEMVHSTVHAFKIDDAGYFHAGIGKTSKAGYVLVLTKALGSSVEIPHNAVHPCTPDVTGAKKYLHAFAASLIAERVVSFGRVHGPIVVICSDHLTLDMIQFKAAASNKVVTFVTSNSDFASGKAIFLHHHSPDNKIRKLLPAVSSALVNLSDREEDENLFNRLSYTLRGSCDQFVDTADMFRHDASCNDAGRSTDSNDQAALHNAFQTFHNLLGVSLDRADLSSSTPSELSHHPLQPLLAILDWTVTDHLYVQAEIPDRNLRLDSEKTYLVIGSSDTSRTLCEWMVDKGAKYIVIASRNPSRLQDWTVEMSGKGAHVQLQSADVTNAASIGAMKVRVERASNDGAVTPPWGGVIHLGLLLRDKAFLNMSFEEFETVVDIKAKGSLNLHQQFANANLDFFILTGSISVIIGNPGQANYNAGNAFIAGLAEYRRSKGLPASVVHLGVLVGVGYLMREARNTGARTLASQNLSVAEMHKMGIYPISERDLHQIFAEAILASPVDAGMNPEMITGLRNIEPEMLTDSHWAKDPLFAHIRTQAAAPNAPAPTVKLSVRQKLTEKVVETQPASTTVVSDSTTESMSEIVGSALVTRLKALLQMDEIDTKANLLDIGLDSLVATEIGSWIRKELKIDVPHSKIFSGASVEDLTKFAVQLMDKETLKDGQRLKGRSRGTTVVGVVSGAGGV
ncbi:hypothetical protein BDV96DRAFT_537235 [Lophiotrema nucula]|uniref:Uncharacterized protein n=1 Tax=Lophiotrema nucula TaxID=690887 RepID=A0A6A5ZSW9_9PLEO|nr:hypothetical protein BDV96DRAFT_537235 [Lophiotrema nucula]